MTRSLLHLGYAKTATTYLQRHVFETSAGINYLGKPFDLSKNRLESFAYKYLKLDGRQIHRFDPFFDHEDVMRVRPSHQIDMGGLAHHLRSILSETDLNVWSHEGYLRPGRKSAPLDRKTAIANLRDVFTAAGSEDVQALIVLRDPKKMLASSAVQFHRDFDYLRIGDLSLEEVAAFVNSDRQDRYAALIWRLWYEYLDYKAMIEDLVGELGKGKVHVLRYEDMVADWSLLESLLQSLHPGITCCFPPVRENTTEDKPYDVSAPIQAYLDQLRDFDPRLIYPDNYEAIDGLYYTRP
ncbi:hypothetical protein Z945_3748 [Sulfitobacter noctilucae]|uniref:sulfotransferase family protein n=1 Tax=Sulfitobacter noctilucae TaxID=1342302 RepID=UPI000468FAE5|nr:sulfotransferase family protein [Sulfitobacter noctilucae]KIN70145.1 hypothetical protein Z945_3748 [Sulfitobacter noctilucae]